MDTRWHTKEDEWDATLSSCTDPWPSGGNMISYKQERNRLQYDYNIHRIKMLKTSRFIVGLTAPLGISAKRFTASRMIVEISSSLRKSKIAIRNYHQVTMHMMQSVRWSLCVYINYPSIKQLIRTGYRLCCTTVSTAAALSSALSRRLSTWYSYIEFFHSQWLETLSSQKFEEHFPNWHEKQQRRKGIAWVGKPQVCC